ncbi:S8 family serine peptidase [Streptomyces uncialis]|uniref:S8 family peptidase n=1 Tax=Streptomyces uncialis TaxID=1048205 RepID=UPI003648100C
MHHTRNGRTGGPGARALVTALTVTAALTTGPAAPASAQQPGAGPDRSAPTGLAPERGVPLITGDRVLLDDRGRVLTVERAPGRERIAVETVRRGGRTYVVPADARRLIDTGRLDRRLFDVTERARDVYRDLHGDGLRVIVRYRDTGRSAAARTAVRAADGIRLERTLRMLGADALTVPDKGTPAFWDTLTDQGADGHRATAPGIDRVWLDAVNKAALDRSVPKVGAPAAWQAGYDGTGVRIAVLDTGIDATHPDLADRLIAERNFSDEPDAQDRLGHGTHVASIALGTGARSGGRNKGVAPGARLLSGKVLNDRGLSPDSMILAGMEWAAEQGADIVNMSLGLLDTPGVEPQEALVDKLSEERGILFTASAGNAGAHGPTSPSTAAAALAVGAVDDGDALAEFSGVGRPADGGVIKPDMTGPGVGIVAAASSRMGGGGTDGYIALSGTSMAAPHVAGAAALLKQKHPHWTYRELKAALTGSALDGGRPAFHQGSGRLRVDRAMEQTVLADPGSLDFGTARWPHDDAPPTRRMTYRNTGTGDVTLDLSVRATGPDGRPAPDGFFSFDRPRLTVPAGGTASVGLTADTRLGGALHGDYSAYTVATYGGRSVSAVAAVHREAESYDVTVVSTGRDGAPAPHHAVALADLSRDSDLPELTHHDPSGTVTVRVRTGKYLLTNTVHTDPLDSTKGMDMFVRPDLDVTGDIVVRADARTTRPVTVTVPDPGARPLGAEAAFRLDHGGGPPLSFGWQLPSYEGLRTAHLGPELPGDALSQVWTGHWADGPAGQYTVVDHAVGSTFPTGRVRHTARGELASVQVGMGASAPGDDGRLVPVAQLPRGMGSGWLVVPQKVPGVRTLRLAAPAGTPWLLHYRQFQGEDETGYPVTAARYSLGTPRRYAPGRTYRTTFNTTVHGPWTGDGHGLFRDGDRLYGTVPLLADGRGHPGSSDLTGARTALYRDGVLVGAVDEPMSAGNGFTVPAGAGRYRLTASVTRDPALARVATRVDASWTFRSRAASGEPVRLPAATVRFGAAVALDGTAPAGRVRSVPVRVRGAVAGVRSLTVAVSYDGGVTWRERPVRDGRVSVRNPAAGRGVALRARVADRDGNTATVTVRDAYRGR